LRSLRKGATAQVDEDVVDIPLDDSASGVAAGAPSADGKENKMNIIKGKLLDKLSRKITMEGIGTHLTHTTMFVFSFFVLMCGSDICFDSTNFD
jgi:hypothetical protein